MSAYVVDREHIAYLVRAAEAWRIHQYFHNGNLSDIGQMLWDENTRSVHYRYPGDDLDLPGSGEAPYLFCMSSRDHWPAYKPVQVLKAIACLRYQSCEHPEFYQSEAERFLSHLQSAATNRLPGYDEAEWGAPERMASTVRRLV